MWSFKNKAKAVRNKLKWHDDWIELILAFLLALISITTFPNWVYSLLEPYWSCCTLITLDHATFIISLIVLMPIIIMYIQRIVLQTKKRPAEEDYLKEQTTNQISRSVFNSLYQINASKINETFRYTYGTVPEWNPINYRNNILVYDVHEQIRSILISIEDLIINLNPERFNDQNVSVELVYCYPEDILDKYAIKSDLPFSEEAINDKDHPWKLISSGDTSGNQQSVMDHLCQETSFFTLLDSMGTIFKNNKFEPIRSYQRRRIKEHLEGVGHSVTISANDPFFIADIRDVERSKENGRMIGSAVGTIINIRNDNPEEVFVKAILTINTYGVMIYDEDKYHGRKDSFGFTAQDYEHIFRNTILSTYSKLLETELAQMYIRHSIRNGYRCATTGRNIRKPSYSTAPCSTCKSGDCPKKSAPASPSYYSY